MSDPNESSRIMRAQWADPNSSHRRRKTRRKPEDAGLSEAGDREDAGIVPRSETYSDLIKAIADAGGGFI